MAGGGKVGGKSGTRARNALHVSGVVVGLVHRRPRRVHMKKKCIYKRAEVRTDGGRGVGVGGSSGKTHANVCNVLGSSLVATTAKSTEAV